MTTLAQYIRDNKIAAKNVYFRKDFVLQNFNDRTSFSTVANEVVKLMLRDEQKCACCGADNIYFHLSKHKKLSARFRIDGKYVKATRDHYILKTLKGSNHLNNMTLLCETCNLLRDSYFAEYKEFKDYYDECMKVHGKYITPEAANYCYIEPLKNLTNNPTKCAVLLDEVKASPHPYIEIFKSSFKKSMGHRKGTKLNDYVPVSEFKQLQESDINFLCNEIMNHTLHVMGYNDKLHYDFSTKLTTEAMKQTKQIMLQLSNIIADNISEYMNSHVPSVTIVPGNSTEIVTKGTLKSVLKIFFKMFLTVKG